MNSNKTLFRFLNIYKKQILILFLLGLFSSGFFLISPYFSKLFIDKAFVDKNLSKFLEFGIWGAIIFVVSTLFKITEDVIRNRIAIKLKLNLTNKFIRKFYALDLSFFHGGSIGENAYRLSDIETVANFILEQCPHILVNVLRLFIILGIALWLNLQMTIFLLILSPLFLLNSIYIQRKLSPIYEKLWEYGARLNKEICEAFSRVLIIKAFGLETFKRHSYLKAMLKNIRWSLKSFRWSIINSLSSSFLSKAIYGAVTLYGGWLIIKDRLTLGSYAAVMIYLTQIGGLLESLSYSFKFFVQEMVSLERFFEVINLEPKIKDSAMAKALKKIDGEIAFQNVWFGYRQERPILKGLDLHIPRFSWTALVGPSGCGKTTLVNLILRLYEPWQGSILIDGLDLRAIKIISLRERISIATQEPLLFDVSIRENISYGLKNISQKQIADVAKISCIDEFIEQLPQGYDTLIGENACRLSQGLKQRIALARAILRNPDLLILDEATSSVDSLTEERIFKQLKSLRKGLTTIIISHRLFSVKDVDKIYFMQSDTNLEAGTHTRLFSESPAYRDFFYNQLE